MVLGRFDRYLLQQLLLLFGFFSLILVLVFWVNKAVSLLDALMGDGQGASTFFELTILGLPSIITSVLPITAFIAAVFGINQLSSDSELVVVQATGFSPWRLGRPVIALGLIAALMMSVLTHVLVPMSLSQASERQSEITRDITSRLLTEGKFIHPISGITFYVRETPASGELFDIFLSDTRTAGERQVYMARRALLVEDDAGPVLLMFDGAAQSYDIESKRLATTTFESFAYSLGGVLGTQTTKQRKLNTVTSFELIQAQSAVSVELSLPPAELSAEVHNRMSKALLAVVAPMLGFAALIAGGFSRFGLWRHIFVAFGMLIVVKAFDSIGASQVQSSPQNWPWAYLPQLVGLLIYALWLWYAANPNSVRALFGMRRPKRPPEDHSPAQGDAL